VKGGRVTQSLARLHFVLAALAIPLPAAAQQPRPPAAAVSTVPVPSELEANRLVWSMMAAVDHANLAGNYSVLRDLAAPGFQINNDAARLTQIFASLRESRIDLSTTLLLTPNYAGPPRLVAPDVMRLQGRFGLRPTAIAFDLYYQWVGGRWRLFGVSIVPASLSTTQPGAAPAPQPQRQPPPQAQTPKKR
jgi:hypothetical protein